jgi:hypothetical protein
MYLVFFNSNICKKLALQASLYGKNATCNILLPCVTKSCFNQMLNIKNLAKHSSLGKFLYRKLDQ